MLRVSLIALLGWGAVAPAAAQSAPADSTPPVAGVGVDSIGGGDAALVDVAHLPDTTRSSVPPLSVRWSAGVGNGATAPPLVAAGRLYVATARHDVKAFSLEGRELWSRRLAQGFQAAPVLAGDVLVVTAPHPDARAYGLDPATGETRWETPVGDVAQAPLLRDGRLVFLSLNGRLTALEPRSGDLLWETRLEGLYPGPANAELSATELHTLSAEGLLARFDPATGQRRGSLRLDASAATLIARPEGNLLVVGHDGRVDPFDVELEPLAGGFATAPVLHAPAAASERLVVPGLDRVLRGYALPSGDGLWSRTFPVAFAGPPAFSPDGARVAIGDLAGTLWTLDASDGRLLSRTEGPGGAVVARWSPEALAAVTDRGSLLVLDPGASDVRPARDAAAPASR